MKILQRTGLLLITLFSLSFVSAQTIDDTLAFDTAPYKENYGAANHQVENYQWTFREAAHPSNPDVDDKFFGTSSVRFKYSATEQCAIFMNEDKPHGLGSISFYAAIYGNDDPTTFEVRYSIDGGLNWITKGTVDLTGVTTLTKYEFSNINVAGNVRIGLFAMAGADDASFNVDSLIFTGYEAPVPTPCDPVTNVSVVQNPDSSLTVTWTPPADLPANGYKVGFFGIGSPDDDFDYFTVDNTQTSYTTDTLTNGATFGGGVIYVAAVKADCGNAESEIVTDTIAINYQGTCLSPDNIVAVNNNDGTITISWDEPLIIPDDGYKVAIIKDGDDSDSTFFVVPSGVTTVTTDSLPNGTPLINDEIYSVYVVSYCEDTLISQYDSTQVKVTFPVDCDPVTGITVVDNGDGSITVSWDSPNNPNEEGYIVGIVESTGTMTANDYFTFDNSTTTFTTNQLKNGDDLEDGTSYTVEVAALCQVADTSSSISGSVTVTVDPGICAKPINLTVTEDGNGKITSTWTAPTTLPDGGYKLAIVKEGDTPAAGDYFDIVKTGTTFSSNKLKDGTAIVPGEGYDVYLYAVCTTGHHSDTLKESISTTIDEEEPTCEKPTNVAISFTESSALNFSWTAPSPAPSNGYLYAVTESSATPQFPNHFVPTNSISVTGLSKTTDTGESLEDGKSYTIHVVSNCGGESSETTKKVFSFSLSVTDLDAIIAGLYPNPTSSTITVELKEASGNMVITDLAGKKIHTTSVTSTQTVIDVAHLPAGIYQVMVSTSNGVSIAKFVKQ